MTGISGLTWIQPHRKSYSLENPSRHPAREDVERFHPEDQAALLALRSVTAAYDPPSKGVALPHLDD